MVKLSICVEDMFQKVLCFLFLNFIFIILFYKLQDALALRRPKFLSTAEYRRNKIQKRSDLRKKAQEYNENLILNEMKSGKEKNPPIKAEHLETLMYRPG